MPDGSTCRSSRSIAWHEQRSDQFADRRAALALTTQEGPVSRQIVKEPRAYAAATHGRQRQRVLSAIDSNPYGGVAAPSPALSIVAGPRQPPAIKTSQHMTATSNLTSLHQCHVAALSVSRPDTRYYLQMPYHKHPSNRKENRCPCGAVYCLAVSPAYSATILSGAGRPPPGEPALPRRQVPQEPTRRRSPKTAKCPPRQKSLPLTESQARLGIANLQAGVLQSVSAKAFSRSLSGNSVVLLSISLPRFGVSSLGSSSLRPSGRPISSLVCILPPFLRLPARSNRNWHTTKSLIGQRRKRWSQGPTACA